jgi:hypothetical protein
MLSEYGPLDRTSSPGTLHGVIESEDVENSAMFVGEVWRRLIVVRRWSLEGGSKVGKKRVLLVGILYGSAYFRSVEHRRISWKVGLLP